MAWAVQFSELVSETIWPVNLLQKSLPAFIAHEGIPAQASFLPYSFRSSLIDVLLFLFYSKQFLFLGLINSLTSWQY